MNIANTIIYLFGHAGCGKLTIAHEIQKLVPAILVDNHFINNIVFSLIDTDGVTPLPKQTWNNVRRVREVVLDTIRDLSHTERNFIFTNELIHGSLEDKDVFNEIATVATQRSAFFFPVRLLISPDELCIRVVSPERKAKLKGIDPVSARKQALEREVLRPSQPYFEIDITDLSAQKSAREIVLALEQRNFI